MKRLHVGKSEPRPGVFWLHGKGAFEKFRGFAGLPAVHQEPGASGEERAGVVTGELLRVVEGSKRLVVAAQASQAAGVCALRKGALRYDCKRTPSGFERFVARLRAAIIGRLQARREKRMPVFS